MGVEWRRRVLEICLIMPPRVLLQELTTTLPPPRKGWAQDSWYFPVTSPTNQLENSLHVTKIDEALTPSQMILPFKNFDCWAESSESVCLLPRLLVSWIKQPFRSLPALVSGLLRGEQPNLSLETGSRRWAGYKVREAPVFSLSMLSESQFAKDNICLITNPALFGQPSLTPMPALSA